MEKIYRAQVMGILKGFFSAQMFAVEPKDAEARLGCDCVIDTF